MDYIQLGIVIGILTCAPLGEVPEMKGCINTGKEIVCGLEY
jgi:hypothetical protein